MSDDKGTEASMTEAVEAADVVEAAHRMLAAAAEHQLQAEVVAEYGMLVAKGFDPLDAMTMALAEWDV